MQAQRYKSPSPDPNLQRSDTDSDSEEGPSIPNGQTRAMNSAGYKVSAQIEYSSPIIFRGARRIFANGANIPPPSLPADCKVWRSRLYCCVLFRVAAFKSAGNNNFRSMEDILFFFGRVSISFLFFFLGWCE